MRDPAAPYPGADDPPEGPAWLGLLPGARAAVSEATTEVPVIAVAPRAANEAEVVVQIERAAPEPPERAGGTAADNLAAVPDDLGAGDGIDVDGRRRRRRRRVGRRLRRRPRPGRCRNGQRRAQRRALRPAPTPLSGLSGAAPASRAPAGSARRPGELPELPITVWPDEAAQRLRERWRDLQGRFIDDPQAAVAEAERLVTEAVRTLSDRLLAERAAFDPYRDGDDRPDTEELRIAMRRYREFLERLLAL
jgi:hypothetical protein